MVWHAIRFHFVAEWSAALGTHCQIKCGMRLKVSCSSLLNMQGNFSHLPVDNCLSVKIMGMNSTIALLALVRI